jgi:hypothetical protein
MLLRDVFLPHDRRVNGAANAFAMQGLNLLAEQVTASQCRMLNARFRRIITLAVMAFGEDGDAIDVGAFHRFREFTGIEFGTDIRNEGRGVEIEMDLTLGERKRGGHGDICIMGLGIKSSPSRYK